MKLEKKDFIQQSKKIEDHYIIDNQNVISQSDSGIITRCQHKTTKVVRVVKIVFKYMFYDYEVFVNEVDKLKELVRLLRNRVGSPQHHPRARIF